MGICMNHMKSDDLVVTFNKSVDFDQSCKCHFDLSTSSMAESYNSKSDQVILILIGLNFTSFHKLLQDLALKSLNDSHN